ncbi:peptide chain release factor N(5)-glutamine methyltransferase [bacterium]|nr:MAG: peptide chain release factor N(5)-glutamine methyltransferase [bacterium]
MSLRDWLLQAESRLAEAGIETPRVEARLLAAHGLGKTKAWILTHGEDPVEGSALEPWLLRRERREPLAHLTGTREFYGRPFRVTADTLVPRPDTETLVELSLELAPMHGRVLDVGTGTGCIGITLALERPDLRVTLIDVSERALRVARENAEALGAEVELEQSDLYGNLDSEPFDLIVSNPPYIRAAEPLMPEVARFEPALALFAGGDGLDFYRRLALETPSRLTGGGQLAIEIGYDQAETVPGLFAESGWRQIAQRPDLAGIVRALAFER